MSAARPLPRLAGGIALAALTLSATAALLVWALGAGRQARQLLGLDFAARPGGLGAALDIAATNSRLAAACLVAGWAVGRRPQLRLAFDVTLGLLVALNMAVVGVALGAYGTRMLEAVALHGPLELAAFALAGAAYLSARPGAFPTAHLAATAAVALALVLTAALLETYVPLGGDP